MTTPSAINDHPVNIGVYINHILNHNQPTHLPALLVATTQYIRQLLDERPTAVIQNETITVRNVQNAMDIVDYERIYDWYPKEIKAVIKNERQSTGMKISELTTLPENASTKAKKAEVATTAAIRAVILAISA